MLAMPDSRFVLLSDAGVLAGFTLDEKKSVARRPFIAPLPDGPEAPNKYAKKNWDAESLVYDANSGQYWVGYEQGQGVWRYGRSFARTLSSNIPKAMKNWPINGAAEAMLRLPDGRTIVFSESAPYKKGGYEALIFNNDPSVAGAIPEIFGYIPPKGYHLTDATLLDKERALLLHRRLSLTEGFTAIITTIDLADITVGATVTSRQIGTLKPPIKIDNMEAIATTRERGDTIIWIASDDNFMSFEENLLLKFRFIPDIQKRKGGKKAHKTEKAEVTPGFSSIQ